MQPDLRPRPQRATVWIVEDDAGYRETVRELVDGEEDLECLQTFGSGEDLFEFLNDHFPPDYVLLDIGLPGMNGIEVAERLRHFSPSTKPVMLTIHEDDERIFQAICAGAYGYLPKSASSEHILEALRDGAPMPPSIARRVLKLFVQFHAPRWDYGLTKKEMQVLEELDSGKTKSEIAKTLCVSPHTIDTHMRGIYQKLHVHSRQEAVAKALKERLIR